MLGHPDEMGFGCNPSVRVESCVLVALQQIGFFFVPRTIERMFQRTRLLLSLKDRNVAPGQFLKDPTSVVGLGLWKSKMAGERIVMMRMLDLTSLCSRSHKCLLLSEKTSVDD